ncbi:hypothetical protein J7E25_08950 [Agromyces sp. ISL-38]|uniref:hypothetical protein n=1 Tax=Agromyces sp. ISL-38 TaxID=2819107 RepID=UPI001BE9A2C3|nr:hypothetical protein [Agromyces sp. ISL-38]MBT2499223.1 hypothetical protein [Agromyces sp. ISL-38]
MSLILQFKRPEYMHGARASQWHLWRAPFYRFQRERLQQATLKRLEVTLAGRAVVRYAAPAFHTLGQLEAAQVSGSVISQSGHVAPSALAGHSVWTYKAGGTHGKRNPDGAAARFELLNSIFVSVQSKDDQAIDSYPGDIARVSTVVDHMRDLGSAAVVREPELRRRLVQWDAQLRRADVPEIVIRPLLHFAAVQSTLARIGATWWLLDANEWRPNT